MNNKLLSMLYNYETERANKDAQENDGRVTFKIERSDV
jgi:hypothetical protein